MKTWEQFLVEKEEMVKMFGTAKTGKKTGALFASSCPKAVNPAKPFNGIQVGDIYSKPKRPPSGIMGK